MTRESFQLDASMNNTIGERFNVAGAAGREAVRQPRPRAEPLRRTVARCRDIGVTSAMYSLVRRSSRSGSWPRWGTAVVYLVGGQLVIDEAIPIGTWFAFVIYTGQIYQPLTPAHETPGSTCSLHS